MNKLFEKNLENWKLSQLASIYNKKLQLQDKYDKDMKGLSNRESEILEATFLPLDEGSYYQFS